MNNIIRDNWNIIEEKVIKSMYEDGSFPLTVADEIIKVLEKQIPKKVIRVNIPPKWGGKIIKCPSCDSKNIGTKFCLDCGQAIDWGNEDE